MRDKNKFVIHPRQNEDIRCILAAMKKPRRLAFENDADHGIIHAKTTLEFGEKLIRDEKPGNRLI